MSGLLYKTGKPSNPIFGLVLLTMLIAVQIPVQSEGFTKEWVSQDTTVRPSTASTKYRVTDSPLVTQVIDLNITFGPNTIAVPPKVRKSLNSLAAALNTPAFASSRLRISGYSDSSGSEITNQHLSQQRADSVRIYLITHGVSNKRLSAIGYGSKHLKFPKRPKDEKNRRIEIVAVGRTLLPLEILQSSTLAISPPPPISALPTPAVERSTSIATISQPPRETAPREIAPASPKIENSPRASGSEPPKKMGAELLSPPPPQSSLPLSSIEQGIPQTNNHHDQNMH
ncbi:hypothetical protein CCP3SC1_250021 [Gammaproteobacteria bacterium]